MVERKKRKKKQQINGYTYAKSMDEIKILSYLEYDIHTHEKYEKQKRDTIEKQKRNKK